LHKEVLALTQQWEWKCLGSSYLATLFHFNSLTLATTAMFMCTPTNHLWLWWINTSKWTSSSPPKEFTDLVKESMSSLLVKEYGQCGLKDRIVLMIPEWEAWESTESTLLSWYKALFQEISLECTSRILTLNHLY
jgi:hypothetical protein